MKLRVPCKAGPEGPAYMSGFTARLVLCVVCALPAIGLAAQTPRYGITVNIDDKKADFAAIKKYAWQRRGVVRQGHRRVDCRRRRR